MLDKITHNVNVGSLSAASTVARTASANVSVVETLAAAKSGTLTRSDADTAVITSNAHGLTDSKTICVFWGAIGGVAGGHKHNCAVTAYDTNTITVDTGTGDDFPAGAATVVTFAQEEPIAVSIDGDAMKAFVVLCDQRANCNFAVAAGTTVKNIIVGKDEAFLWMSGTDDLGNTVTAHANPLTGDPVTQCIVANSSTTAATLYISHNYDATV